jgi:phospholipid transport system substrate-binding protein
MKLYFPKALLAACILVTNLADGADAQIDKLDRTIDAALDVLYSAESAALPVAEKQAKVRAILESNYDLNVIIRRAIGRNWERMDADEQERVVELVKQLTVKSYVKGMKGKERPEIALGDLVKLSDKRAEIDSTVRLDGKTYHVLYRLGRMPSGWQIYDIVAENISVVSNYRQQIDDHFRRSDAGSLITRLEELLEKDEIDETIQI